MAVVQGRTRAQLRQSVGYNLGAIRTGTAYDAGSTTTLISLSILGGDDTWKGHWLVVDDASSTTTRIVTAYSESAKRLTVQQALSFSTVAGDTFELWQDIYPPDNINEFLNQAIMDATGAFYDPVEKLDLHTDGHTQRFDIPSGLSMVQNIFYRSKVSSTRLHACGDIFDTNSVTYFSVAKDTEDKKQGSNSLKFTLNDGGDLGQGTFLYDTISSKDISKYDYIEFWVKSSIDTAAGNLKLHLDDGAIVADGSDLETIDIPALSEDTWTFVRAKLTNPELNTAIVSVGLEQDSDLNSSTKYFVWLDDISVVRNDTAQWNQIPRHLWKTDREASDIVLDSVVHGVARYNLLKIIGGDKPALMTSDSDTSEVPEFYLIARATELAFAATSGGPQTDYDGHNNMAGYWSIQASRAKRAIPMLTNVRLVA